MQVVTLASRKGGSGKTTLAGQLAVEAERRGDGPVALADLDPQGSLADWWNARTADTPVFAQTPAAANEAGTADAEASTAARTYTHDRWRADLAAVETHRPGFPFWQHVFMIPDGRIIFGSAEDGRLLAEFPVRGDWRHAGESVCVASES